MSARGSCLCGGVRYVIEGPLRPVCACHCLQCRKTSGHYVAATQCRQVHLSITETTLAWYGSSVAAERGFCRRCGSNLFWRRHGSDNVSIFAGTLDGSTGLAMNAQIHVETAGDYYTLPDVAIIPQDALD